MNLQQYTEAVRQIILLEFKNITESEVNEGLKKNVDFIKSCFDGGFTVRHVVHELTI